MRITPVVGYAHYVDNTRIAIAAKVLVQSKNLFRLNCSLGLCLDDANILQHLPLPGGLLRVVRRYIVNQRAYKREHGGGLSLSRQHHTHWAVEAGRWAVEALKRAGEAGHGAVLPIQWAGAEQSFNPILVGMVKKSISRYTVPIRSNDHHKNLQKKFLHADKLKIREVFPADKTWF
jgi:hypothetical protein